MEENLTGPEVFTKIADAVAIISRNGVYMQCELFDLRNYVFAKHRGGYIQLYHDGGTSTGARIHKIVGDCAFGYDKLRRLVHVADALKHNLITQFNNTI